MLKKRQRLFFCNAKLKDDNKDLKDGLERVSSIVDAQSAAEKRKEIFYQEWLEGVLGGKHKRLSIGITDVSNDDLDVEIKVYRNAAMGVAQLNLYNSLTNAPNKVLALFDTPPKWKPSNGLVEICDLHAIRLVLLREDKTAKSIKTKFGHESDWCDKDEEVRALFFPRSIPCAAEAFTVATNGPDAIVSSTSKSFALFVQLAIYPDNARDAHFTVKDALGLWRKLAGERGYPFLNPIPKEHEFKAQFSETFHIECQERATITHPDKSRTLPRSTFRNFRLRAAEAFRLTV